MYILGVVSLSESFAVGDDADGNDGSTQHTNFVFVEFQTHHLVHRRFNVMYNI